MWWYYFYFILLENVVSIYNSKTSKSSSVDVIQSLKEYKIIIFKLFSDRLSRNKFFFCCALLTCVENQLRYTTAIYRAHRLYYNEWLARQMIREHYTPAIHLHNPNHTVLLGLLINIQQSGYCRWCVLFRKQKKA